MSQTVKAKCPRCLNYTVSCDVRYVPGIGEPGLLAVETVGLCECDPSELTPEEEDQIVESAKEWYDYSR